MKMAIATQGLLAARKEIKNIQKQMDFAAANTITTMAFSSKKVVDAQILRRLDRPTRYTQRAVEVIKARRNTLLSIVRVSSNQGRSDTLKHLFLGGTRTRKGYERVLNRIGALPTGMYTVPGAAAPINTFGNIRKAFIDKMIKQLRGVKIPRNTKSTLPPGIWQRITPRRKHKKGTSASRGARKELFVVHEQVSASDKPRKADAPKPEAIMLFVESPKYRKRFDMLKTVEGVISKDYKREFDKNFKRALATAKRK